MSMLGNSTFSGIVNTAGQTASISAAQAVIDHISTNQVTAESVVTNGLTTAGFEVVTVVGYAPNTLNGAIVGTVLPFMTEPNLPPAATTADPKLLTLPPLIQPVSLFLVNEGAPYAPQPLSANIGISTNPTTTSTNLANPVTLAALSPFGVQFGYVADGGQPTIDPFGQIGGSIGTFVGNPVGATFWTASVGNSYLTYTVQTAPLTAGEVKVYFTYRTPVVAPFV